MRRLKILSCAWLALLAGCAARHEVASVGAPPPVVATLPPPLPAGATPGMRIPVRLPDGSYPTPNRSLSAAATLWHLRAGLNVAALSCRGPEGDAIVAGYNAMLTRHKATLAAAESALAAEFRGSGAADWRAAYDDAMTRLYNYFSQTPARPAFCAAATRVLADTAALAPGMLQTAAGPGMAALDQPFTDFYRAYDAWRAGTVATVAPALPRTVIAAASAAGSAPAAPAPAPRPRLEIDPAVFTAP